MFGVGAGWNREEMANHGTDPASRFELLRERVLAMKAIWTEDEAAFEGKYVKFGRLWSWPKPRQKPHPPIMIGGAGKGALRRVVEIGDGWIPAFWTVKSDLGERIAELRRLAAEAGRRMPTVSVLGATGKELAGDVDPDVETLRRYEAVGVSRWIFRLPSSPPDAVLSRLSKLSVTIDHFTQL